MTDGIDMEPTIRALTETDTEGTPRRGGESYCGNRRD